MSATDLVQEIMRAAAAPEAAKAVSAAALAYVRVSTDMQEDKGLSIPAQRRKDRLSRLTLPSEGQRSAPAEPPRVDAAVMRRYAESLPSLLQYASNEEKRGLVGAFVSGMALDPDTRQIEVGLRLPLFPPTCGGGDRN